jgi:hypothetical protein
MRLSTIWSRYNVLARDLEMEFHTDKYAIVCEPLYRFDVDAPDDALVCYDIAELDAGIRVPQYYKWYHLFRILPPRLRKVVVTRNGEVLKTFHNVVNDMRV